MIRITTPLDASWSRAAERATADRKAGNIAQRVAANLYSVQSQSKPGTYHAVRIRNVGALEGTCDCEHGRSGSSKGHCRHLANALMSEIARVSRKPAQPQSTPERKAEVDAFMARFARA